MINEIVRLNNQELIAISGGSIISLKKRAMELLIKIAEGIVEDVVVEAWDCFWETFE